MKTILTILPLLLAAISAGAAPTVSLAWEPSPDADVVKYRLYCGPSTGTYSFSRDLGNVTNTVFTNMVAGGHYWFVVTAINAGGAESDPSNEIDLAVPVSPPRNLRITQSLQASASPAGPWREVGTLQSLLAAEDAAQFYRVKLAIEPPPTP